MPEYFYGPDDPTQPVGPNSPHNPPSSPQQGQQGKLVLGSFKDQQETPKRRPYQYQPQPPVQPGPEATQLARPYPYSQGTPQGPQSAPNAVNGPNPNYVNGPNPSYFNGPAASPNVGNYPYRPASTPDNVAPDRRGGVRPRRRRRGGCGIGCLVVLVVLLILGTFTVTTAQRVLAFGSNISTQSPLSTQTGYMGTSDRVNLLVLGYGGGTHAGGLLTDSILVVSLLPQTHHTSLVSIPRDLFVQVPSGSGNYARLNTAYNVGSNYGKDRVAGGNAVAQKVSAITGLDVKYWMTIDFTGFKQLIDSIGGVDVYVPDSFSACYPKNDDDKIDASWIKVEFKKGNQHMDGTHAMQYARAREPLEVCGMGTSSNLAELTDFGRSARQQIIVKGMISKVKQVSTWPSMFNAMAALEKTIHTNLSLADLAQFSLKMDLNDAKTAHIGLSNQNVLVDQVRDGQAVLWPANDNWDALPAYVKQHLYN